jgi:hypothetical protein
VDVSNHLGVATVSASLGDLLKGPVSHDVPGAEVTAVRPNGGGALPDIGVNLFLYQVAPSPSVRNDDLPTRDSDGRTVARPRVGLDLHYLLSFYGSEADLQPQRLLGSAVRTLHARPLLTRERIRDTVAHHGFLATSNLADDIDLVKLSPLTMSLEELSRLWSVLLETQYTLSVSYQATVVFIESDEPYSSGLPVLSRNVYVEALRQVVVERVLAAAGEAEPILAGSAIRVLGRALDGPGARVLVDGDGVVPDSVAPSEIGATLPATLRAGLHALQVQHVRRMGTPPADHTGVDSNIGAFVLRPRITQTGGSYDIDLANQVDHGDGTHSADVTVHIEPDVTRAQRVALALNEDTTGQAQSYTFVSEPHPADSTDAIDFEVRHVNPADYLVRVQVDGAESPLEMTGGSFSDPRVTL